MMCRMPLAVLGPYSAAPGPSTTSIRCMSSLLLGMKWSRFTRSEGTPAMRLSVRACSEPEKMLLKPRATTLADWSPVLATSIPGTARRCSTAATAGRSSMARSPTTSTRAGALTAFSGRLEAETTMGSSRARRVSPGAGAGVCCAPAPGAVHRVAITANDRLPATRLRMHTSGRGVGSRVPRTRRTA